MFGPLGTANGTFGLVDADVADAGAGAGAGLMIGALGIWTNSIVSMTFVSIVVVMMSYIAVLARWGGVQVLTLIGCCRQGLGYRRST